MSAIEKIRADFVKYSEIANRARDEMMRRNQGQAYPHELEAQIWNFAVGIIERHVAEDAKEQSTESSGPMPWRLQIGVVLLAAPNKLDTPADALKYADKLIAEHERTK